MTVYKEEKDYLWEHFKFNADQRLKAFNFFVVLSVFANGGAFAAFEKQAPPLLLIVIGVFIVLLALVFWAIDYRSQHLTFLAVPGLKAYESQFPEHSRLFTQDTARGKKIVRYTNAFRTLYVAQVLVGAGVVVYGFERLLCW